MNEALLPAETPLAMTGFLQLVVGFLGTILGTFFWGRFLMFCLVLIFYSVSSIQVEQSATCIKFKNAHNLAFPVISKVRNPSESLHKLVRPSG